MPNSLIATAIGLGMAYAAAPGAVNTEALRRGVRRGARSALLVETGSLIGDSLWAVLAFTGVTLLTRYLALQMALGITGGFFLLRLAWLALFLVGSGKQCGRLGSDRLAVWVVLCWFLSRGCALVSRNQRGYPLGTPLDSNADVSFDQCLVWPGVGVFWHSCPLDDHARLVGTSGGFNTALMKDEFTAFRCFS